MYTQENASIQKQQKNSRRSLGSNCPAIRPAASIRLRTAARNSRGSKQNLIPLFFLFLPSRKIYVSLMTTSNTIAGAHSPKKCELGAAQKYRIRQSSNCLSLSRFSFGGFRVTLFLRFSLFFPLPLTDFFVFFFSGLGRLNNADALLPLPHENSIHGTRHL